MALVELWRNQCPWISEETPRVEKQEESVNTFEAKLLGAIESSLELFGKGIPRTVLYHSCWLGIKNEEIPFKPREFEHCLDTVFRAASSGVKKAICIEVAKKFGLSGNFTDLASCFEAARQAS